MKQIMLRTGFGALALAIVLSSCVSKRKYTEAQNTIEQYRADSAQWAQRSATMQQNLSGLEEKNKALQRQWDSTQSLAKTQQQRWEGFQSYYDQQKTTTEQLHQKVHQALDNSGFVKADDIVARNGKVYISVDDKAMFASGSTRLSSKGKQALEKLADVIKGEDNIVVNIASSTSYAAYWGDGTGTDKAAAATDQSKAVDDTADNQKQDAAHLDDPDKKQDATETKTDDKQKADSDNANADRKKTESGKNKISFRPKTKSSGKSTAESWSTTMAKATIIAKELSNNEVSHIGVIAPGKGTSMQNDMGAKASGEMMSNRGFQIILSSRDDYYHRTVEGQESTSMR